MPTTLDSLPVELLAHIAQYLEDFELVFGDKNNIHDQTNEGAWPVHTRRSQDDVLSFRLFGKKFYTASLAVFASVLGDNPFSITRGGLETLDAIASHEGLRHKIQTLTFGDHMLHWKRTAQALNHALIGSLDLEEAELVEVLHMSLRKSWCEEALHWRFPERLEVFKSILTKFTQLTHLRLQCTPLPVWPKHLLPDRVLETLASRPEMIPGWPCIRARVNRSLDVILTALLHCKVRLQTLLIDEMLLMCSSPTIFKGLSALCRSGLFISLTKFRGGAYRYMKKEPQLQVNLLVSLLNTAPLLTDLSWWSGPDTCITDLETRVDPRPLLKSLECCGGQSELNSMAFLCGDQLETLRMSRHFPSHPVTQDFDGLPLLRKILPRLSLIRLDWSVWADSDDATVKEFFEVLQKAKNSIPLVRLWIMRSNDCRNLVFFHGEKVMETSSENDSVSAGHEIERLFQLPIDQIKFGEEKRLLGNLGGDNIGWTLPFERA